MIAKPGKVLRCNSLVGPCTEEIVQGLQPCARNPYSVSKPGSLEGSKSKLHVVGIVFYKKDISAGFRVHCSLLVECSSKC